MAYKTDYETVIGLEVHAELKTDSKIFCACSTEFGAEPNTQVCPVCLGLPGTLPVLNERVVELAVRAGLALNCTIADSVKQDRKNYYYPDLPKAYQISQYDQPLCRCGYIEIETQNGKKKIGITRIHIEEDAGKLFHKDGATLIDHNRCGVPLIEIVSEPDIRSAAEAVAFLKKLRSILLYTGVSDGKMNEGSMRCDVNLSVRLFGEPLGVRCEMKNLNSFKFIEKAIEYEAGRQIEVIESGGAVLLETRRFDEDDCKTYSMRKKESQSDYRFFREPDLPEFSLSGEKIEKIRASVPALPDERRRMYFDSYGIPYGDSEVLTDTPACADYFEKAASLTKYPKNAANLILSEIMGIAEAGDSFERIAPRNLAALCDLMGDMTVNSATAKKLIRQMWEQDFDPKKKVEEEGLSQINDEDKILTFVLSAIEKSAKAVEDYKKGKETAMKSIIGRAMGESRGQANPSTVAAICERELKKLL